MATSATSQAGRNSNGTYARGNPGRPVGSRHKTTLAVLALLDEEAEGLTRRVVELALAGDVTALKLCLGHHQKLLAARPAEQRRD